VEIWSAFSKQRSREANLCVMGQPDLTEGATKVKVKVKVTLRPTTSRSVSPGFKAPVGLTIGYLFLLTFTSIVLSITGAPSDERSGLSFFIVIVRPLLVNSQSHITTDDQSVSASWFRAPSGAHDQILITVWQLLFCRYRAPPLTRGRVCHLI
jgi:hypothetical protein